jgi:hypothetical protein
MVAKYPHQPSRGRWIPESVLVIHKLFHRVEVSQG